MIHSCELVLLDHIMGRIASRSYCHAAMLLTPGGLITHRRKKRGTASRSLFFPFCKLREGMPRSVAPLRLIGRGGRSNQIICSAVMLFLVHFRFQRFLFHGILSHALQESFCLPGFNRPAVRAAPANGGLAGYFLAKRQRGLARGA